MGIPVLPAAGNAAFYLSYANLLSLSMLNAEIRTISNSALGTYLYNDRPIYSSSFTQGYNPPFCPLDGDPLANVDPGAAPSAAPSASRGRGGGGCPTPSPAAFASPSARTVAVPSSQNSTSPSSPSVPFLTSPPRARPRRSRSWCAPEGASSRRARWVRTARSSSRKKKPPRCAPRGWRRPLETVWCSRRRRGRARLTVLLTARRPGRRLRVDPHLRGRRVGYN